MKKMKILSSLSQARFFLCRELDFGLGIVETQLRVSCGLIRRREQQTRTNQTTTATSTRQLRPDPDSIVR